ncbi:hypothetical protein D9M69_686790 [compost metagenome]
MEGSKQTHLAFRPSAGNHRLVIAELGYRIAQVVEHNHRIERVEVDIGVVTARRLDAQMRTHVTVEQYLAPRSA